MSKKVHIGNVHVYGGFSSFRPGDIVQCISEEEWILIGQLQPIEIPTDFDEWYKDKIKEDIKTVRKNILIMEGEKHELEELLKRVKNDYEGQEACERLEEEAQLRSENQEPEPEREGGDLPF